MRLDIATRQPRWWHLDVGDRPGLGRAGPDRSGDGRTRTVGVDPCTGKPTRTARSEHRATDVQSNGSLKTDRLLHPGERRRPEQHRLRPSVRAAWSPWPSQPFSTAAHPNLFMQVGKSGQGFIYWMQAIWAASSKDQADRTRPYDGSRRPECGASPPCGLGTEAGRISRQRAVVRARAASKRCTGAWNANGVPNMTLLGLSADNSGWFQRGERLLERHQSGTALVWVSGFRSTRPVAGGCPVARVQPGPVNTRCTMVPFEETLAALEPNPNWSALSPSKVMFGTPLASTPSAALRGCPGLTTARCREIRPASVPRPHGGLAPHSGVLDPSYGRVPIRLVLA